MKNKFLKTGLLIFSAGCMAMSFAACSKKSDTDQSSREDLIVGVNDYLRYNTAKVVSVKDDKTALVEITEGADDIQKGDKVYISTENIRLERYRKNKEGNLMAVNTIANSYKVKSGDSVHFETAINDKYPQKNGCKYINDIDEAYVQVVDDEEYKEDFGSQTFADNGKVISIAQNGDLLMKFENNGCGFFKENEDTAVVHYDRAIVYEYSSIKGKGKITDSEYTPKVGDTLQVYAEPKNTYSESDTAFAYRDGKPYVKATGSLVKYVEK